MSYISSGLMTPRPPLPQRTRFAGCQHRRQVLRRLGAGDVVQPGQVYIEHLLLKEKQRRLGLILRGGRHLALHRRITEECLDLCGPHLFGMPLAVEENEAPRPVRIGLFGADAVVQRPDPATHLVQEFGWGMGGWLAAFYAENIRRPKFLSKGALCYRYSMFTPSCVVLVIYHVLG